MIGDKQELGRITDAWLGMDDDHRFVMVTIAFEFGGSGQALQYGLPEKPRQFIRELCGFLKTHRLDQLKNKYYYAMRYDGEFIQGLKELEPDGGKEFDFRKFNEEEKKE